MNDHDFAQTLLTMAEKDVQALHAMGNNDVFADENRQSVSTFLNSFM